MNNRPSFDDENRIPHQRGAEDTAFDNQLRADLSAWAEQIRPPAPNLDALAAPSTPKRALARRWAVPAGAAGLVAAAAVTAAIVVPSAGQNSSVVPAASQPTASSESSKDDKSPDKSDGKSDKAGSKSYVAEAGAVSVCVTSRVSEPDDQGTVTILGSGEDSGQGSGKHSAEVRATGSAPGQAEDIAPTGGAGSERETLKASPAPAPAGAAATREGKGPEEVQLSAVAPAGSDAGGALTTSGGKECAGGPGELVPLSDDEVGAGVASGGFATMPESAQGADGRKASGPMTPVGPMVAFVMADAKGGSSGDDSAHKEDSHGSMFAGYLAGTLAQAGKLAELKSLQHNATTVNGKPAAVAEWAGTGPWPSITGPQRCVLWQQQPTRVAAYCAQAERSSKLPSAGELAKSASSGFDELMKSVTAESAPASAPVPTK